MSVVVQFHREGETNPPWAIQESFQKEIGVGGNGDEKGG